MSDDHIDRLAVASDPKGMGVAEGEPVSVQNSEAPQARDTPTVSFVL